MSLGHERSSRIATYRTNLITTMKVLFSGDQWSSVWIVGGAVRDALNGKSSRDIDLITTLPGNTLISLGFRHVVGKSTLPIFFRSQPDSSIVVSRNWWLTLRGVILPLMPLL
jgi:Poly A polymerase head domain